MQPAGFHCGQGSLKPYVEKKEVATNGSKGGVNNEQLSHTQIFAMCFHCPPHEPAVWQLSEMVQSMNSGARLPGFESWFYLSLAKTLDELL